MSPFPALVTCPYGPHEQSVNRSNSYPCPRCGGVYRVDDRARVHPIRAPRRPGRRSNQTHVVMEFPSDASLVTPIRRAVRLVANGMGMKGADLGDLELCFEEALMNIIIHGYAYDRTRPVHVETSLDKGQNVFTLVLKDQGRIIPGGWKVDKAKVRQRVKQRKAGGLGKFLIEELMDRVTLKREDGWNVLTMERSLEVR